MHKNGIKNQKYTDYKPNVYWKNNNEILIRKCTWIRKIELRKATIEMCKNKNFFLKTSLWVMKCEVKLLIKIEQKIKMKT